jgi:hypothetical protein
MGGEGLASAWELLGRPYEGSPMTDAREGLAVTPATKAWIDDLVGKIAHGPV